DQFGSLAAEVCRRGQSTGEKQSMVDGARFAVEGRVNGALVGRHKMEKDAQVAIVCAIEQRVEDAQRSLLSFLPVDPASLDANSERRQLKPDSPDARREGRAAILRQLARNAYLPPQVVETPPLDGVQQLVVLG